MDTTTGVLIGRDRELAEARELLRNARSERVARLSRITGPSGIGKTAFVRTVAEYATRDGWVAALSSSHRIQSTLPLVVARRMIAAIVDALGEDASRYTSGLDAEIQSVASGLTQESRTVEDALFRLAEAVLLDRPLLLAIDDVQWTDPESRLLITRLVQALADRPLALLTTERSGSGTETTLELTDAAIVLGELDLEATAQLARTLLPSATNEVIRAIAEQTRGRAIDVTALARSAGDPAAMTIDDVTASVRAIIARDVALLDNDAREFLQICSLILDPIDYDILRVLWPDEDKLLALIARCSGRFLIQERDGLHFVHAAVAQSIRETVAIEIPYRKRIIDALKRLHSPRLEDYERLVEQASASGDRALEMQFLRDLADEAERRKSLPVAARALDRLIALTPFQPATSLPIYQRLSMMYNVLTRDLETHRVCSEALERALASGVRTGLGELVVSELFSLFLRGERADFDRTLERFDRYLSDAHDRSLLLAAKLFIASNDYDENSFDRARTEYESLKGTSPLLDIRFHCFDGTRRACLGDMDGARNAYDQSRSLASANAPALLVMVQNAEAFTIFQTYGPGSSRTTEIVRTLTPDLKPFFTALSAISTGNASDAIHDVAEALVHLDGTNARRLLFGAAAVAASVGDVSIPQEFAATIERDGSLMETAPSGWILPMVAYSSFSLARSNETESKKRLRRMLETIARKPVELMIPLYPIVLVRLASLLRDREALDIIATGGLKHNLLPLNVAHYDLARIAAGRALGNAVKTEHIDDVASRFTLLGAPFFANVAGGYRNRKSSSSDAVGNRLTRRESEVVMLVAEGLSNREIAERLVLSERTVEAHVANIFSKLNMSSRTHVAAWFTRVSLTPLQN